MFAFSGLEKGQSWARLLTCILSLLHRRRALAEATARLQEAVASEAALARALGHTHLERPGHGGEGSQHTAWAPAPLADATGGAALSLADLASSVDAGFGLLVADAVAAFGDADGTADGSSPSHGGVEPPSRSSPPQSPEARAAAAVARVMLRVSGGLPHGERRNPAGSRHVGGGGLVEEANDFANDVDRGGHQRGRGETGGGANGGGANGANKSNDNSGSSSSLELPFQGGQAEFGGRGQGEPGGLSPPHPVRRRWPGAGSSSNNTTNNNSASTRAGAQAGVMSPLHLTQSALQRRRDELRLAIQGLSVQLTLALSDDEGSGTASPRKSQASNASSDDARIATGQARDNEQEESAARQALTLELRRKRAALMEVEALLERLPSPLNACEKNSYG